MATSQLPWFYYSQPVPGVSPGGLWTHPLEIAMEALSRKASNLNGTGEKVLIHICTKHHHRAGAQAPLEHCQARVSLPMRLRWAMQIVPVRQQTSGEVGFEPRSGWLTAEKSRFPGRTCVLLYSTLSPRKESLWEHVGAPVGSEWADCTPWRQGQV